MPVNSVLAPFPVFLDAAGVPLENGYIYVGQPGFEARSNPKASYFDTALTISTGTSSGAAVRTKAGVPVNTSNAPAMFYVDGDYSISVTDKNGALVFSALNNTLAVNVGSVGPALGTDGNLAAVGIGFTNEPNTGFVRSATTTMQTVVGGVLVAQQTPTGTVFNQPVSGSGFSSGVTSEIGVNLAAIRSLATNGILARTGSGTAAARTITAGTGVSVTNGDGVAGNPTISSNARVLLSSQTASASATLNFTAFNNAVYRYYEFEFENVKPATNAVAFNARTSTDGGATYDSGASSYAYLGLASSATGNASFGSNTGTLIQLTNGGDMGNGASAFGFTGQARLYFAGDASTQTRLQFFGNYDNSAASAPISVTGAARRLAAQDTDAIQFFMGTGNIASGIIRMYGVLA